MQDDVILSFNGVAVIDENHLINLVSLADIGTAARMEIHRTKRQQIVSVQLTDRDDYRSAADAAEAFQTR